MIIIFKNDGKDKLEMSSYFEMKGSTSGARSGTEQRTFMCVLCLFPEEFKLNASGVDQWIRWTWDFTGHSEGLGAHMYVYWELVKMMWYWLILPRVKWTIILARLI